MQASAADAFAVLIDPETYPRWLIGTKRIREVDDGWPRPGSRFHHVVGIGPFQIRDHSIALDLEHGTMLRLKVNARPPVSAIATFRVIGNDTRCVVTLEEEPALRLIGNLVRPVLDPMTHVRNHRSLRRLATLIESRRSQHQSRSPIRAVT